jgi:regulator of sirC expression with transglutaminase-like and TPR domain
MGLPMDLRAPSALAYFQSLVADDVTLPLTEAVAAISLVEYPTLDVQSLLADIDRLAERLARRVPADCAPVQRLRYLNRHFFQELGFGGNVNDYYDPRNSYLSDVVSRRRGIPITLAVLYIEMAGQLGLQARGISFPGHFLVKMRMPAGEVVIDPFTGQSLSREMLEERLSPYRQQRGLGDDDEVPLGLFLQAATPREIVARVLRNLKDIHRNARDAQRLLAVQDRLVAVLPQAWDERRDRGFAFEAAGFAARAAEDLRCYLDHCPDAEDAPQVRQRLRTLLPRLH